MCRSEEFCESGMGRGATMPVSFLTNVQKQCYGVDMWHKVLIWLGFRGQSHAHGHGHRTAAHGDAHTHGAVDPVIATTARGIWAIQWSFVILAVTAALQLAMLLLSGSVALLADTIHNVGDAATAVPLWIAFLFARRHASAAGQAPDTARA